MENIHTLDSETVESLMNMFNSGDKDNIRMALTILNNANFNDSTVIEFVKELNNECDGLHFALFINNVNKIRPRFSYILPYNKRSVLTSERHNIIDDDSSLDDGEWFPYDPHNDLNK